MHIVFSVIIDLFFRLDAEPELSFVALDDNGSTSRNPMQPQEHAINWDELLIEERQDEEGEGRLEIIDEDQLYVLLGLGTEDEAAGGLPSNEDQATTINGSTVPDIDTTTRYTSTGSFVL